jgi:hypothetical protein
MPSVASICRDETEDNQRKINRGIMSQEMVVAYFQCFGICLRKSRKPQTTRTICELRCETGNLSAGHWMVPINMQFERKNKGKIQ